MKKINNEKGYSLLLTLMLILLFSILGASLMAMTFNGAQKNETREHITQAQDLATKGLERIEKQVQNDLKTFLKTFPHKGQNAELTNTEFEIHFNNIIDSYDCDKNKSITSRGQSDTGEFITCIDEVKNLSDGSDSKTKKELIFKSTGIKGKQESVVYETIEMGADDIQKVLNYTVSTLKNGDNGGNLYLHGGSEIKGDMNISGNIFSRNYGYAFYPYYKDRNARPKDYFGDIWFQSILPRSLTYRNEAGKETRSKLNINGNGYTFSTSSPKEYSAHISGDFSQGYKKIEDLENNLSMIFDSPYTPVINTTAESIDAIDFEQEFNKLDQTKSQAYNRSVEIRSNFITDKNVYINGDLYIRNSNDLIIDAKRFYVTGDVYINNVNLQANFTLFTKKSITIREVTISGIKERNGNIRGSIIAFANGKFKLSNISEFDDSPSEIKGFFYSNQTMELYGFGSNTKIIGGIAGNNIVLNAMRGDSEDSLDEWRTEKGQGIIRRNKILAWSKDPPWYRCDIIFWCEDIIGEVDIRAPYQELSFYNHNEGKYETNYFETPKSQENKTSRLQIEYDHDLLDTYRNSIDYTSSVIKPEDVDNPIKKGRSYEAP